MNEQEKPKDDPTATWATLAAPCVLGEPAAVMVVLDQPTTEDIVIIPTNSNPEDTFQSEPV
jgi:hypothetical protein